MKRLVTNFLKRNAGKVFRYALLVEVKNITKYNHCQQAIYAMQIFLPSHEIGRAIPKELFQCPGIESFEDDLSHLAKALNAIEGKRGFPSPPK